MTLMSGEIREKHDACLVGVGRALEDMAREGHRGRERRAIRAGVAAIERLERDRCRGRDRVEDPEERVRVRAIRSVGDEPLVVEIVARIHPYADR